jgi:LAO/AO transport system kinase
LWQRIGEHRLYLEAEGRLEQRRRRNATGQVLAAAAACATRRLERALADTPELDHLLDRVQRRQLDPLSAARALVAKVFTC